MVEVSVLIPFYNAEATLSHTIDSVLRQTFSDLEIILVDDGSSDDGFSIASSYASDKIKVFQQPNKGACAARNFAFEMSSGHFIQYLDADDMLAPDKIEKQLTILRSSGMTSSVASGKWVEYYDENDVRKNNLSIYMDFARPADMLAEMWQTGEMMCPAVWLVPRIVIENAGGWNETLHVNQDGEFFCRVLLSAEKIVFADCVSYYRKGNQSSVSNSRFKPEKVRSLLDSFLLYENHVHAFKDEIKMRRGLANNYYYFIYTYYHLFPELVNVAIKKVREIGLKPERSLSDLSNFSRVSQIIGFYNTLRLRRLLFRAGLIYRKREKNNDLPGISLPAII